MSPHFLTIGEFPCYWDWLRYAGLPLVLVSIAFLLSPSISWCFSIHSSPAIGFHSFFFFIRICTHSPMVNFQASDCHSYSRGLPDVVVPEAEHGVCRKQKSRFKFLP